MRFFLLLLGFLLCGSNAMAARWVSIEPDRFNLLYAEGEKANVVVRALHLPQNPAYEIKVSVEFLSENSDLELNGRVGVFTTPELSAGSPQIRVVVKLSGPDSWERVVEDRSIQLTVRPLGEL